MSWQIGSFAILAGALAAGFLWYERTRPDARIVALVGTLAALAALGRIAFAALPNIKPTTDIVLISGYALGGAPGFVVGAVAGLSSNFFFGQGPWTPWQMAAWGMTGVFGGGLAILTGRRIGRWPLAAVCALIGYAFTAVQDLGDWVTYSNHSLAQLGVYVGKGTGFDFVHAFGCLAFALAFGPSLLRSIQRFAARLQVVWQASAPRAPSIARALDGVGPRTIAALVPLAIAAVLLSPAPARAASPTSYLLGAQNGDGGFGAAPGQPSSQLFSGWAALGLAAQGHNPQDVRNGGASATDYIQSAGGGLTSDPGTIERTILVAHAAGMSATSFGGQNLVAALQNQIRGDGSVSDQVNLTSFAVMALSAAGVSPPGQMLSWLAHQQDRDGGFNFATGGASSDVDDTGAVLEAFAAGGASEPAGAVQYIESQQNADGGFPMQSGGPSNAQSAAWAAQGLIAAGVAPDSVHRGGSPSPLDYLRSLIQPDGHVRYSSSSDQTPVWVTAQAAMALAGKPVLLAPVARASGGSGGSAKGRGGQAGKASGSRRASTAGQGAAAERRLIAALEAKLDGFAAGVGALTALTLAPVNAD